MNCVKCKTSLPKDCKMLSEDELAKIVGGIAVSTIIELIIAAGGLTYAAGYEAGKSAYYKGLRNDEYQRIKWDLRWAVLSLPGGTSIVAGIVLWGFQNGFYECVKNWG